MTIYVGQDVAVTITAVDADGNAANPDTVQFRVKDPSGTTTTYVVGTDDEATEVTTGKVYRLVFDASTAGTWHVRSEALDASSNAIGVDEVAIIISKSTVL